MTCFTPLLSINDLCISFKASRGNIPVLCGVDLEVHRKQIVGLVGESGSGKSLTALAVMGLLGGNGLITQGSIVFDGIALHEASQQTMQRVRGKRIAMVFQDPVRSLNPTLTVGKQIGEMLRFHNGLSKSDARRKSAELLHRVGIADPSARLDTYPFQLSGGMCQRVAIAMALACGPDLLIADEPTTGLDVTVQAQIMSLLKEIQDETGMGLLLITHDLGVVAAVCDRVAVMNSGRIVEEASVDSLFSHPVHPYTYALLQAKREGAVL